MGGEDVPGRRTLSWLAVIVSLVTWGLVAFEHWGILQLDWHRAGVLLVLLGPLLVVYGVGLLRHVYTPPAPDGTGDYGGAPPPQWVVPAMLSPLLIEWFERPLTGRGGLITFLVATRTTTLAALAVLLLYLIALVRLRYRLTATHLEVYVAGKLVLAMQRGSVIYVQGIAGNAEQAEAERFGPVPGAIPVEAPGVPFGHGARVYYNRDGQPHILVLAMTPELREALTRWLMSHQTPVRKPR